MTQPKKSKPALAVILQGGLVTAIVSNRPEALADWTVVVIDYDTEGVDPDEISLVRQADGTLEQAIVQQDEVTLAEIGLDDFPAAYPYAEEGR